MNTLYRLLTLVTLSFTLSACGDSGAGSDNDNSPANPETIQNNEELVPEAASEPASDSKLTDSQNSAPEVPATASGDQDDENNQNNNNLEDANRKNDEQEQAPDTTDNSDSDTDAANNSGEESDTEDSSREDSHTRAEDANGEETSDTSPDADSQPLIERPCHPAHLLNCLLPYPSDVWSKADSTSPTGIRLAMPENLLPEALENELPVGINIQKIFNGSSGYSAASAVLFELASAPQPDSLPADGGNSVIAINLSTGERTPITVQLSNYARSTQVSSPAQVIEIFPRSRWQFGARYVVAITRSIKALNGDSYTPAEGFSALLQNGGSENAQSYDTALNYLESAGFTRNSLLNATVFTVRTEDEVTAPLTQISKEVYQNEHPVKNLWVVYGNADHPIAATVFGELRTDNFRAADGSMLYEREHDSTRWVDFRLTLPKAANLQPVPISLYGHGLGINKESDFVVARSNAKLGIATISIDQPNHGIRVWDDGGSVFKLLSPAHLPRQIGMLVHSPVDFMSLLKAVSSSLSDINVLPRNGAATISPICNLNNQGDIPDLDSSRILYQGTSLGGVLGSTFVALAPNIKGAFLHVPGSGITRILSESVLWDSFFYKLMPASANGAEALVLRAAIQHEIDYGDSVNFIHYLRESQPGIPAKAVGIVVAKGDLLVPNNASMAMAEIAELPLVGAELIPMPGLVHTEDFVDGYGIRQIPSISQHHFNIPAIDGLISHGSFISPQGEATMRKWLSMMTAAQE
jgi:hypothetical protein